MSNQNDSLNHQVHNLEEFNAQLSNRKTALENMEKLLTGELDATIINQVAATLANELHLTQDLIRQNPQYALQIRELLTQNSKIYREATERAYGL